MMHWNDLLSAERVGNCKARDPRPERTPFDADKQAITHSFAWRRLRGKTQVHGSSGGDFVRDRMTHSLEVESNAETLARAVGLWIRENDPNARSIDPYDLSAICSAASRAHDIGHPPFGHHGEDVIRWWFKSSHTAAELLDRLTEAERTDFEQFEANSWNFRIVARLEHGERSGGLQLTCATLATMSKYPRPSLIADKCPWPKAGFTVQDAPLFADVAAKTGLKQLGRGTWARHPLAYLVEAADDIAYRVTDIEDAEKLGYLEFRTAEQMLFPFIRDELKEYRELSNETHKMAFLRSRSISKLISHAIDTFKANYESIMRGGFHNHLLFQTPHWDQLRKNERRTKEMVFAQRDRQDSQLQRSHLMTTLLEAYGQAILELDPTRTRRRVVNPRSSSLLAEVNGMNIASLSPYERVLRLMDHIDGMTDEYATRKAKAIGSVCRG